MLRSKSVLFGLAAAGLAVSPASSWERAKGLPYAAVAECPNADHLCVFVSCPAKGRPRFEAMIFEHGLNHGDPVTLRIDDKTFILKLPKPTPQELYSWQLEQDLELALLRAKSAGIQTDPTMAFFRISLRNAQRRIGGLLKSCGKRINAPSIEEAASEAPKPLPNEAVAAPVGAASGIAAGRTLSTALQLESYKAAMKGLTRDRRETWLTHSESRVESPSSSVSIDGQTFERFEACMPHACDEFSAVVLFAENGARSFALVHDGRMVVLLGNPPATIATFLTRGSKVDVSADATSSETPRNPAPAIGVVAKGPEPLAGSSGAATKKYRPLDGLSEDQGCATAETDGVILAIRQAKGRVAIEGFQFKDKFGTDYVNVSLPSRISKAKRAEVYAALRAAQRSRQPLQVKVKGCGASGSVQVLDAIAPAD